MTSFDSLPDELILKIVKMATDEGAILRVAKEVRPRLPGRRPLQGLRPVQEGGYRLLAVEGLRQYLDAEWIGLWYWLGIWSWEGRFCCRGVRQHRNQGNHNACMRHEGC